MDKQVKMNSSVSQNAWRVATRNFVGKLDRFKELYDSVGPYRSVRIATQYLLMTFRQSIFDYYRLIEKIRDLANGEFTFNGFTYKYFHHRHNTTWRNERIVEIPIVWTEVQKYDAKQVLEFGNVLSYYFPVHHCVVDKYDRRAGLNVDILDLRLPKKYDLIVSISTIEHVGFNEGKYAGQNQVTPHSAEKIRRAIDVLQEYLAPHGKLIITAPLGYNPELDDLLRKDRILTGAKYLKRISRSNKWIEVREGEIKNVEYDAPYSGASVVALCFFEQGIT
jgi:hypothetical protein